MLSFITTVNGNISQVSGRAEVSHVALNSYFTAVTFADSSALSTDSPVLCSSFLFKTLRPEQFEKAA
jgi:hypothetical protein